MPCIICTIWGNMNFLGIYNVKTQRITRQKNQNRARYAGAFWGKITFFRIKDNKVPCIIEAIWGKFNFLGISVVKTHCVIWQKSQNSVQYADAFWVNNHFFGRKVNKVPCIIVEIRVQIIFLGIFVIKIYWIFKYCSICWRILRKKSHYLEKKSINAL